MTSFYFATFLLMRQKSKSIILRLLVVINSIFLCTVPVHQKHQTEEGSNILHHENKIMFTVKETRKLSWS